MADAIGYALFGSRSKELVLADRGLDSPLDYAETMALMALRYAHLTKSLLQGERGERYSEALRQVQAATVDLVRERNMRISRPMPSQVVKLAVDLSDPYSDLPVPSSVSHLSKDEAVVPLISLVSANIVLPFEINVPVEVRRQALEALTLEMGLGRQFGADVFTADDLARKELKAGGTNWLKWIALGVGAAAVIIATGGLALVAAPGVAGAAAITSALAAFGPGGMIGGLFTAGTLVSAGGGGIAIGLASPNTTAATVEAVVTAQLTAAILRERQGLDQDPATWATFTETSIEVGRELARLQPISDDSSPTVKDLQRKLSALDRAIAYLDEHGLAPQDALDPGF